MSVQLLEADAGEKEVHFASRQESVYPNLMRLCMDFNFKVRQCTSHRFHLTLEDQPRASITPAFEHLEALEAHVHQHMVDILHGYLCGDHPLAH